MITNYDKNFKEALRFVSKTETRPILTGVLHRPDGTMTATDSHRLIFIKNAHTMYDLPCEKVWNKDNEEVKGNYPDVSRIIPKGEGSKISVNINEWLQLHTQIKKENKNAERVWMKIPKEMKIDFVSYHDGFIENEYTMEHHSPYELEISYNVNYMMDALKTLKSLGYKECTLTIKNGMSPMLITVDDENVIILILPIRMAEDKPRIRTVADIEAIINIGDLIEFKNKDKETIQAQVTKVNRKYYHIVLDGKECKVAKDACKKVS